MYAEVLYRLSKIEVMGANMRLQGKLTLPAAKKKYKKY